MASITINANTSADVQKLLALFALGASASGLQEIAAAMVRSNDEQKAQLEQMRLFQTQLKEEIMKELDDVMKEISETRGTVASVTVFITAMEQKLDEALANGNTVEDVRNSLRGMVAELKDQRHALAEAIDNDPSTPAQQGGAEVGPGTDGAEGGTSAEGDAGAEGTDNGASSTR